MVVINTANKNFSFLSPEFKEKSILYQPLSKLAPAFFKYLDFNEIKEEVKEKTDSIDI